MPDGTFGYTRDGSFSLDAQGQLVTQTGYLVEPGLTVPQTATAVTISAQGLVQATIPGQTAQQNIGTVQLSRFINKTGLNSVGDSLFTETAASGQAVDGTPGADGFGNLQQNYLEDANVNAVTEISGLIAAQRAYEMNSKVITAADQMLSSTTQMFRG
jgi:flagellar basal-body rod protein FlgG